MNDILIKEIEEILLWDSEECILPPRSRLYHLEPLGIGTAFVESLTSYSSRLATAHNVTHASLFGKEIAPHIDRHHLRNSASRVNENALLASFRTLARAVNGTGITALDYVTALEKLTLRKDLRFLTMITWSSVLSHRHLIKPVKAWCPSCYEEWNLQGLPLKEPLLWSLEVVTSCPRHFRRLRSNCNRCNQSLHLLDSHSRVGYCSRCKSWLGESLSNALAPEDVPERKELEWQTWVVEHTGDLFVAAPQMAVLPLKQVIAESINRCIERSEYKNEFAFSRALNIAQSTVNDWRRGDSIPQLDNLIKLCFIAQVSPLDFISGNLPHCFTSTGAPTKANKKQPCKSRRASTSRNKSIDFEKAKHLFKAMLALNPPISMDEIATKINCPSTSLRKRFPELCCAAIVRYKDYVSKRRNERWEIARVTLEDGLKEDLSPSVQDLARRLNCSRNPLVKHFPELCALITRKYNQNRRSQWDQVKDAIKAALKESIPRPIKIIAKQIGRSHTSIYNYFPSLCRLLSRRYGLFRQECSRKRKAQFQQEIKEIAIALHEKGLYPSVKRVEQHLSPHRSLRNSKVALSTLRDVRKALGFDTTPNNFARFVIS